MDSSFKIVIVDENPIRAAILEDGLREAGHVQVVRIDEMAHLLARSSGRIINVGANAAGKAAAGMGPYAASKSAVARLTESLAEELKDRRITVNAVLPSIIDTPQNRADMPDADFSRWVPPEAIAEVILFLASDAAWAVTGASIPVVGRVV